MAHPSSASWSRPRPLLEGALARRLSLTPDFSRVDVFVSLLFVLAFTSICDAAERELIRDPHFQGGFHLLAPKPGNRVVYAESTGLAAGKPVWDLAQWSSRFPLQPTNCFSTDQTRVCSNSSKIIVVGKSDSAEADLSLAINAGIEYPQARKSTSEPWVHLLVQQDLSEPPALAPLTAFNFHVEAHL